MKFFIFYLIMTNVVMPALLIGINTYRSGAGLDTFIVKHERTDDQSIIFMYLIFFFFFGFVLEFVLVLVYPFFVLKHKGINKRKIANILDDIDDLENRLVVSDNEESNNIVNAITDLEKELARVRSLSPWRQALVD